MFTFYNTNAVFTCKHLGSNGESMGQRLVSRPQKTVRWLVRCVEWDKDNVSKQTFFEIGCTKIEASHLYRYIRRSKAHRGIFAGWSNVETDLSIRGMLCSTDQSHENTKVWTPGRSLRSSSQKTDTQRTWCQNCPNLSLYRLINDTTVATNSAQATESVRCEQTSGNIGKLIDESMETH